MGKNSIIISIINILEINDFFDETETILHYFNFSKKTLLLIPHQSMNNIFLNYLYSLLNQAHGFEFWHT
jgi:hypothetical protein